MDRGTISRSAPPALRRVSVTVFLTSKNCLWQRQQFLEEMKSPTQWSLLRPLLWQCSEPKVSRSGGRAARTCSSPPKSCQGDAQHERSSVSGCSKRCFRCSRLHVDVEAELLVVELLGSGRTNVGAGCPAERTPLLPAAMPAATPTSACAAGHAGASSCASR
jgi:hypothetical protein